MSSTDFGDIRFDENNRPKLSTRVLGVPVENIVDGLVKAKSIPVIKKEAEVKENTTQLTELSTFEGLVKDLNNLTQQLRGPKLLSGIDDAFGSKSAFLTGANVSSTLGVTAKENADIGRFNVRVERVARSDQLVGRKTANDTDAVIGDASETLTLTANGVTANISLAANSTLKDAANAINAGVLGTNVKAEVLDLGGGSDFQLVLRTNDTGTAIEVSGTGADSLGIARRQASNTFQNKDDAGTGDNDETLNISLDGTDYAITLAANATVADVRDQINAFSVANSLDLSASITDTAGSLQLELARTNRAGGISVDDSGLSLVDFTGQAMDTSQKSALETNLSAQMTYQGLTVTRKTNTFDDLVDGVTFDLFQAQPGVDIGVSVEADLNTAKTTIVAFVEAHNALNKFLDDQQTLNGDGSISKDAVLYGNSLLRNTNQQISSILTAGALGLSGGSGAPTSLGDIGLEVSLSSQEQNVATSGDIRIDETRLDEVLLNHFDAVRRVFAYSAESSNNEFVSIDRPAVINADITRSGIEVNVRERGGEYVTATKQGGGTLNFNQLTTDTFLSGFVPDRDSSQLTTNGQKLTFDVGGATFDVDFTGNLTLDGIASAINADADNTAGAVGNMRIINASVIAEDGEFRLQLQHSTPTTDFSVSGNAVSTINMSGIVTLDTSAPGAVIKQTDGLRTGDTFRIVDQDASTNSVVAMARSVVANTSVQLEISAASNGVNSAVTNFDIIKDGTEEVLLTFGGNQASSLAESASIIGSSIGLTGLNSGNKRTLTGVGPGKAFQTGDSVTLIDQSNPANTITATVDRYDRITGEFKFTVNAITGSGVVSDWNIRRNGSDFTLQADNATSSSNVTFDTTSVGNTVNISVEAGKAFTLGDTIKLEDRNDPTRFITGTVSSYDAGTGVLKFSATSVGGTGSSSDLRVSPEYGANEYSLTVDKAKDFSIGDLFELGVNGQEATHYAVGRVTGYNVSTGELKFTVERSEGNGSFDDWKIRGYNGTITNKIVRGSGALDGFVFAYEGKDIRPGGSVNASFTISQGAGDRLAGLFQRVLEPTIGTLQQEKDTLKSRNDTLARDIERIKTSVADYRERLTKQFINVQRQLAILNQTKRSIGAFSQQGRDDG
jgi:flagellar capping protein FliD